jgi:hypothetical protein
MERLLMADKAPKTQRSAGEALLVAGSELVGKVRDLAAAGNVRRLIIRKPGGDALFEIPLTAGVVAGAAMIALAPVLAAVGALAALVARVRLEVVRKGGNDGGGPG